MEKLIQPKTKEPSFEGTHSYVGNNVDKAYYDSGAGYVIPEGVRNRSYEYNFRNKMEKAGLEPVFVDILTLRYVYSMTWTDISNELGIVSVSTAYRLHKTALAVLKSKGFGK